MVSEGQEGDECIIIVQGTAAVYANSIELSDLGPGSQFGELALTGPWVRSATVTAKTPVVALALHRDRYEHLCRTQPAIGIKIQRALNRHCAERLAALTHRLERLQRALIGDYDGAP